MQKKRMDSLYEACLYGDREKLNEEACRRFGFFRCDNREEEETLLEMYQDVIFNHLRWRFRQDLFRVVEDHVDRGELCTLLMETYAREDPCSTHYRFLQSFFHRRPVTTTHDSISTRRNEAMDQGRTKETGAGGTTGS